VRGAVGQKVDVTITYLEQRERPALPPVERPPEKIAILRAQRPPLHFYRYLYSVIGDPHKWVSRKRANDDELAAIIHDPEVYIYVLYVGGAPAGMAEIDGRNRREAEVKFFGLAPEFLGRGFGKYFFANVIDLAWATNPSRLRLETCTLDHPAALPLYQKFGFTVFDRQNGQVELLDDE